MGFAAGDQAAGGVICPRTRPAKGYKCSHRCYVFTVFSLGYIKYHYFILIVFISTHLCPLFASVPPAFNTTHTTWHRLYLEGKKAAWRLIPRCDARESRERVLDFPCHPVARTNVMLIRQEAVRARARAWRDTATTQAVEYSSGVAMAARVSVRVCVLAGRRDHRSIGQMMEKKK